MMQRSSFAYVPAPCVRAHLLRSSFVKRVCISRRCVQSVRTPPACMSIATSSRTKSATLSPLAALTTTVGAALLPFLALPARAHAVCSTPQCSQCSQCMSASHRGAQRFSTRVVRVNGARSDTLCCTRRAAWVGSVEAPTVAVGSTTSMVRNVIPAAADTLVHKFLKLALLAGIVCLIITAATISVFWIIQDSLVYKPTKVWRGTPASNGMPHYEDVNYCTVDGVQIIGWFIKQAPDAFREARTLIYFHGTDKNASFRLKKVVGLYQKCKCNILLLSYRGYGPSTGKPNERGVRIDAESAYEYLKSRGDIEVGSEGNLWVYGESLGGAVAVYFCNIYQHCIKALILENTFTSLLDMIKLQFPILGIFRYLSRNRWQSKKRIKNIAIPLLFLSGLKDSYIPPAMMRKMHELASKSPLKELVEFEDGTHNGTWTNEGFFDSVANFMERVDAEEAPSCLQERARLNVFEATTTTTTTTSEDGGGGGGGGGRFAATA